MKISLRILLLTQLPFYQDKLYTWNLHYINVTYVRDLASMFTIVCENTIMIWACSTSSKISPVWIICFILTTLNNEQHLYRYVIVDDDIALSNSTNVTNLIADEFSITMEHTNAFV